MSEIIINTEKDLFNYVHKEPNAMSGKEWIEHQLSQGEYISGKGLANIVNNHSSNDVVGCEVGVCLGVTSEYYANNIKNLKTLYCFDNYPEYVDWNGIVMNREKQDAMKDHAFQRLQNFGDKIKFIYDSSETFAQSIAEETLDFVFIDADHSYEGALNDFRRYFNDLSVILFQVKSILSFLRLIYGLEKKRINY